MPQYGTPAALTDPLGTVLVALALLVTASQPWFVILATRILRRGWRRGLIGPSIAAIAAGLRDRAPAAPESSSGVCVSDVTFLASAAIIAGLLLLTEWRVILVAVPLALVLLQLLILDIEHRWLPDHVVVPLLATGLAAPFATGGDSLAALIGAALGGGTLFVIQHGYRALRGFEGLGGGDVKLIAAIGAWCGWQALPLIVGGAALAALLVIAIGALASRRRPDARTEVPFGAYLAGAFWGFWWLGWYAT